MISKDFEYLSPKSIKEACLLLSENKNSMILAGGTDLLVKLRKGSHRPDLVVDLKKIPEIGGICVKDGLISLGAAVTITEIKENNDIKRLLPALYQAACEFGCYEIRNRATIGGNICNASPGAETGGPLMVYNAKLKISKGDSERIVPIGEFLTGPGRTVLQAGEILTEITIPVPPERSRSGYRRTARVRGQDLATCAVTVMAVNPDEFERREIKVAMSAMMGTPYRSGDLERILSGKIISQEVVENAKKWMRENLNPRASSLRGTPEYKKEAVGGMLEILLEELGLTAEV